MTGWWIRQKRLRRLRRRNKTKTKDSFLSLFGETLKAELAAREVSLENGDRSIVTRQKRRKQDDMASFVLGNGTNWDTSQMVGYEKRRSGEQNDRGKSAVQEEGSFEEHGREAGVSRAGEEERRGGGGKVTGMGDDRGVEDGDEEEGSEGERKEWEGGEDERGNGGDESQGDSDDTEDDDEKGNDDDDHENDDDDDVEGEDSEEEASENGEQKEMINVDFQFFNFSPDDYHGVKTLLRTFLDDEPWAIASLADAVCSQASVGSAVKSEEEDDPLGFISSLSLTKAKAKDWRKDVMRFVQLNASDMSQWERIWQLVETSDVHLLLCERVVNFPFQLVPMMYESLLQEMELTGSSGRLISTANSPQYFLIISRAYRELPRGKGVRGSQASMRIASKGHGNPDLIYVHPEVEAFSKMAIASIVFSSDSSTQAAHQVQGLHQLRVVYLVKASSLVECMTSIRDMVDD